MKSLSKLTILSFFLIAVAFGSCKKDDSTPAVDIRTQVVGTYSGTDTAVIQFSSVPSLQMADMTIVDTVTISAILTPNVGDGVTLTEVAKNIAYKVTTASATNGLTFSLPVQSIKSATGDNVTVEGYSCYKIGTQNYPGGFDKATKHLIFGYKGNVAVSNGAGSVNVPMYKTFTLFVK